MIPLLIFATLKDKIPRIIALVVTIISILIYVPFASAQPFEAHNNTFITENEITFVGEPHVSFWSGEGQGEVKIIKYDEGYNFKLSGAHGRIYQFTISDDVQEYHFKYYYDDGLQTVVIEKTD